MLDALPEPRNSRLPALEISKRLQSCSDCSLFCVFASAFSEDDDQQHFELFLPVNRMRMARGHNDGLALMQCEIHAVNRDSAHAVEARHKGITARLVRADFLALVEGKERHAQGIVLCQRLADDLPRLIGNLIFQRQTEKSQNSPSKKVRNMQKNPDEIERFQPDLVGVSGFEPEASWSRRLVGYFWRTFQGISAPFRSGYFTAVSFPIRIIPPVFSAFGSRFGSGQKISGAETAPL